jgi:nucleotide-binding universal stress UspA family protein
MQTSANDSQLLIRFVSPTQIVVATNLADSETLLPHAIAQAKASGAELILVHAIPPHDRDGASGHTHESEKMLESEAHRKLMAMADQVERRGVTCTVVVQCGLARDVILGVIERTGATRLITGTHRHGHAGPLMLGSVANVLLREVAVPLFVVGPYAVQGIPDAIPHRILHTVSLKGEYRQHAQFAVELAEAYGAELTLLHVMPYYLHKSSCADSLCTRTKNALAELIPTSGNPKQAIHIAVACGQLVEEVVKAATANKADWVVMGIKRDFPYWSKSNNAAYQVLAEAGCPVLTLRGHLHETKAASVADSNRLPDAKDAHPTAA